MIDYEIAIIDSQPVMRLGLEAAMRRTGLSATAVDVSRRAVKLLLSGALTGRLPDAVVADGPALSLVRSVAPKCGPGGRRPRIVLFGTAEQGAAEVSCRLDRNSQPDAVVAAIIDAPRGRDERRRGLTSRETEILAMAAEGFASAAIAERLFISPGTVKLHLHHAYRKLGARNRAAAVSAALQAGVICAPLRR